MVYNVVVPAIDVIHELVKQCENAAIIDSYGGRLMKYILYHRALLK